MVLLVPAAQLGRNQLVKYYCNIDRPDPARARATFGCIASQVRISLSLAALVRYDFAIIRQASRRDQIDGALKLGHRTERRDDFLAKRFGW
jgi:hypothetical protein